MKNIINTIVKNGGGAFIALAVLIVPLLAPQAVHAADYYPSYASSIDYSYSASPSYASSIDYSYPSYSPSYASSIDYSYSSYSPSYASSVDYTYPSYSPSYASSIDYSYPATSPSYASSIDYTYPASYDTTDYADNYSSQIDYVGGSSFGGNYGSGVSYIGGSSFGPSNNNCSLLGCGGNNGCSHNCGNNTPPPTDICPNLSGLQTSLPNGYDIKNGKCVVQQHYAYTPPPTYYQPVQPVQPYITLSQVPYTGLSLSDLGPVGQAVFYSLFALAAFAAFYIVKMVFTYRSMKRG